jgi:type IV secretory pathway component VirB8
MLDNRLKIILTLLGGVIFAMIFILLALVVPVKKTKTYIPTQKASTKMGQISQEARNR